MCELPVQSPLDGDQAQYPAVGRELELHLYRVETVGVRHPAVNRNLASFSPRALPPPVDEAERSAP